MRHVPVLLHEVIEGLHIQPGMIVVDCNLGDGGHTEHIVRHTKGDVTVAGFDLDPDAIQRATGNIESAVEEMHAQHILVKKPIVHYIRKNFRHFTEGLHSVGIGNDSSDANGSDGQIDAVLFDLGLSSYELEESGRGFSFRNDEPLSMTFGTATDHPFTASDIVNTWEAEHIETIIRLYGEDKFAKRIADKIISIREDGGIAESSSSKGNRAATSPIQTVIKTTGQLAEIIRSAYPASMRFGRTHPATKTFQALRIAVNDELTSLQEALPQAFEALRKGGRMVVLSYHSLEDRIVKNMFKEWAETNGKVLTKRPLVPSDSEIKQNPRSRSAKMRIIEKQ